MKTRARKMTRQQAPKRTGRLPVDIDHAQLEILARIGCTHEEIAAVLKISVDTLTRRFAEEIKKGREAGKSSLRRAQWKAALGGSIPMLIWLGKQLLGQRDRQEVEATHHAIPVMRVRWVDPDDADDA